MDRVRRLAQYWNWLPAFRAVAETEHLPTAAEDLGVSAPGLSRMIKLLEADLGQTLFRRDRGRLELDDRGKVFLRYVRDAMRLIDDGFSAVQNSAFEGVLRIAASHSLSRSVVLPACRKVMLDYPRLQPEITVIKSSKAPARIKKGEIDIALVEAIDVDPELDVAHAGELTYSVYAGESHAFANRKTLSLTDLAEEGFIAPPEPGPDGWPPNRRRRVLLRLGSIDLALDEARQGKLLITASDDIAVYATGLVRLDLPPVGRRPLFVVCRKRLSQETDRTSVMVATILAVAAKSLKTSPQA